MTVFKYIGLGFFFLLASCVNDLDKIKKITSKANDPEQRTEELYVIQTDDGFPQFRLYSKLAEAYSSPEKLTKFKSGFKVEFYDDHGKLESILTAHYGEINETRQTMKALDSVQMYYPATKRTVSTEALYWNQGDSLIFTDKMVYIKSPTEWLYGKGLKAKQDFSYYQFLEPQGKILLK